MVARPGNPPRDARGGWYQLLTGPGPAAIAVIRVTGPETGLFLRQHVRPRSPASEQTWQAGRFRRAALLDLQGVALDDILVSVHAGPPAWDVRLHLHANPHLVEACSAILARATVLQQYADSPATPCGGLWQTPDRIGSESYALLPSILTLRGAALLLAQIEILRSNVARWLRCDDDALLRAECAATAERAKLWKWFMEPARVALVGPPNAGKSTLLNALTESSASIVSATAGTTRDWVDVPGECQGFPVTWIDTAGLRPTSDALEHAGVEATRRVVSEADAAIVVLDGDPAVRAQQHEFLGARGVPLVARTRNDCLVVNKSDLARTAAELDSLEAFVRTLEQRFTQPVIPVSARTGANLAKLKQKLVHEVLRLESGPLSGPCAFTERQAALLRRVAEEPASKNRPVCLLELLGRADSDVRVGEQTARLAPTVES